MAAGFSENTTTTLERNGWSVVELPEGLTLEVLRRKGAPFRGSRYFERFAGEVAETPTSEGSIAVYSGILEGTLNRRYEDCERLLVDFGRTLPDGCEALIGSAATYVYLLSHHRAAKGTFPIPGYYTWTSDRYRETHLVVGVFGRERPIVVAPLSEKQGKGVGVMPLIVPAQARG